MLSVRKEELLTNGLVGLAGILFSVLNLFADKDSLAGISFAVIVFLYADAY